MNPDWQDLLGAAAGVEQVLPTVSAISERAPSAKLRRKIESARIKLVGAVLQLYAAAEEMEKLGGVVDE